VVVCDIEGVGAKIGELTAGQYAPEQNILYGENIFSSGAFGEAAENKCSSGVDFAAGGV
jgi:hypothetical protein